MSNEGHRHSTAPKTATALLLMSSGIREMSHQVRQIAIARIGRHHQNLMSVAMTCNDYGDGRVEQVDDETLWIDVNRVETDTVWIMGVQEWLPLSLQQYRRTRTKLITTLLNFSPGITVSHLSLLVTASHSSLMIHDVLASGHFWDLSDINNLYFTCLNYLNYQPSHPCPSWIHWPLWSSINCICILRPRCPPFLAVLWPLEVKASRRSRCRWSLMKSMTPIPWGTPPLEIATTGPVI